MAQVSAKDPPRKVRLPLTERLAQGPLPLFEAAKIKQPLKYGKKGRTAVSSAFLKDSFVEEKDVLTGQLSALSLLSAKTSPGKSRSSEAVLQEPEIGSPRGKHTARDRGITRNLSPVGPPVYGKHSYFRSWQFC